MKALYRRCQAYQALGEVEKSYADAVELKRIEPGNKAVEDLFVSCVKTLGSQLTYFLQPNLHDYHLIKEFNLSHNLLPYQSF